MSARDELVQWLRFLDGVVEELDAAVARAEKAETLLHRLADDDSEAHAVLQQWRRPAARTERTVSTDWYWCVTHRRAEQDDGSNGHTHVGPLFTKAEAEAWAQWRRPVTERDEP